MAGRSANCESSTIVPNRAVTINRHSTLFLVLFQNTIDQFRGGGRQQVPMFHHFAGEPTPSDRLVGPRAGGRSPPLHLRVQ